MEVLFIKGPLTSGYLGQMEAMEWMNGWTENVLAILLYSIDRVGKALHAFIPLRMDFGSAIWGRGGGAIKYSPYHRIR